MSTFSRRRLLGVGGVGAALALAGCSSLTDDPGGDGASDPGETNGGGEAAVTVVADIDDEDEMEIREEMRAEQAELQQQYEEGEIDDDEAQEWMQEIEREAQEAQLELLAASVEAIEERVGDTDGLSVAESTPEVGVLLVDGGTDRIVELLDADAVGALLAEEQFEALQQPGS